MQRQRRWVLLATFAVAGACVHEGTTGPSGTVGPIGPFPAGVTGKIAFATTANITAGSHAYSETKVHVVDVANPTDRVIFTAAQNVYVDALTWAPDGEHLVVQTYAPSLSGPPVLQLLQMSAAGTGVTVIFDLNGPEYHPAYSRDGRLAYFGGWTGLPTTGIFIDGQSVHPCSPDASYDLSWPPTGDALVFTDYSGLEHLALRDGTVTTLLAAELDESIRQPSVSPDGSRIAFMRFGGNRQGEELWTVAANGGDPRQLTSGFSDEFPQWTPDGKYLAFARIGGGAGGYLIALGGGAPVRVIEGDVFPMAWSQ